MKKIRVASVLMVASLVWGGGISASAVTPYASPELKNELRYIVEEEKLARDVYTALATTTGSRRFVNIARAEQTHMDAVARILKTYGIWNPTLTRAPGVFYDKSLADLYTTLVASGSQSWAAANAAGVAIEERDILDLTKMLKGVTQTDIKFVLEALKAGSTNHLAAFKRN